MKPDKLIVLGFGGHARSIADVAIAAGVPALAFVDAGAAPGEEFAGFNAVVQCPSIEPGWAVLPAAGDNRIREGQIAAYGGRAPLYTLVSPHAYVGVGGTLGRAVFVAHHAHLGPCAQLGDGCIVNTGAIVDHEAWIGRCAHVSINATVAGRCRIGERVFLGAGSVVIDGVSIAADVVVGAGAVVIADLEEAGTYVGVPARRLRR